MKHLKKFNESSSFEPEVSEINDLFKIHSYWIMGIEFKLDDNGIKRINRVLNDHLEKGRNIEKTIDRFNELAEKYKGFQFDDFDASGTADRDWDIESFTIDIISPNDEWWKGFGERTAGGGSELYEIKKHGDSETDEKSKDYKEWVRLGKKWGFR